MKKERLYYLDWLRIGAFALLILFHCTRFFDFFPWHVKNEEQSELVTQLFLFTTSWRMPLIFFVSGAGTFFAMRSRGDQFVKDRIKRLIIPFLFGILILIPPQKYYEFLFYNEVQLSYVAFLEIYPSQIANANNGINLTWFGLLGYHIWYLPYLFVQTMLLLPIFRWMHRKPTSFYRLQHIAWWFVIVVAINLLLRPYFRAYLDWADFGHFLFFFFLGYFFVLYREELVPKVLQAQNFMLVLAIGTSLLTHYFALFTPYMIKWIDSPDFSLDYYGFIALRAINALAWVVLLLGWSIRYLSKPHRILPALNESILPVYMLHQTFIILIGFHVVQLRTPILLKFLIILVGAGILMYISYQGIKKGNATRYLFGMKPRK